MATARHRCNTNPMLLAEKLVISCNIAQLEKMKQIEYVDDEDEETNAGNNK
jgi:hypothetical protein